MPWQELESTALNGFERFATSPGRSGRESRHRSRARRHRPCLFSSLGVRENRAHLRGLGAGPGNPGLAETQQPQKAPFLAGDSHQTRKKVITNPPARDPDSRSRPNRETEIPRPVSPRLKFPPGADSGESGMESGNPRARFPSLKKPGNRGNRPRGIRFRDRRVTSITAVGSPGIIY